MSNKMFFYILFIVISLSSCKTESQRLNGHWHEYLLNSDNLDYRNCFIVSDATFAINRFTIGGVVDKSDYENENFWVSTYYADDLIAKKVIEKNKITFGDTLVWKRQDNDNQTFISDFSAGIKLHIVPFKTNDTIFDTPRLERNNHFIYVGEAKKEFANKSKDILEGGYYIQLNDQITTVKTNDLLMFMSCYHCNYENIDVFIHADINIPKSLLRAIENKISYFNIDVKSQVYYLHFNETEKKVGYKRRTIN